MARWDVFKREVKRCEATGKVFSAHSESTHLVLGWIEDRDRIVAAATAFHNTLAAAGGQAEMWDFERSSTVVVKVLAQHL